MIYLGGHEWDCRKRNAPIRFIDVRGPHDLAVLFELAAHEELDPSWREPTNDDHQLIADQISWELEGVYSQSRLQWEDFEGPHHREGRAA